MGDLSSIPGLGRCPGEGNGNLLPAFLPGEFHGQRSLGTVHWVAKSKTWLSDFHTHTLRELRSYMLQGQKEKSVSHFFRNWPGDIFGTDLVWNFYLYADFSPFFFSFWLCNMACGTLVPQSGIKHVPSARRVHSPDYWTAWKFPFLISSIFKNIFPIRQKEGHVVPFSDRACLELAW